MSIPRETLGLAAEFAVASELCRWGLYAQLTLGNKKRTDLLVHNEETNTFLRIEVKAKQGRGGSDWFIRLPKSNGTDTVYMLVSVPTGDLDKPGTPRVFLMKPEEISQAMESYQEDRHSRGTGDEKWQPAIRWKDSLPHENRWDKLPA